MSKEQTKQVLNQLVADLATISNHAPNSLVHARCNFHDNASINGPTYGNVRRSIR